MLCLATLARADVFNMPSGQTSLQTVAVGNPGNGNDPGNARGAVSYAYRIGKYEVTVGQYTEFLNAVADTDTYALYRTPMAISRSGVSGSYTYSVIGSADHPVTYVSWGDAARFSNWLHNGQPTGLQDATTTERGAYTLDGATSTATLNSVSRNTGAQWFIPTENEWYKAAYHQPSTQGGDTDNYWLYPTKTNSTPNSDQPPGDPSILTNVGNFYRDDSLANGFNDGYAVTGSTSYISSQNYLTDAGAYTSAPSFYGTFDQGGNVVEWNEALVSESYRGLRGASYFGHSDSLQSSFWGGTNPTNEYDDIGFRVATVPEPSTFALAAIGTLAALGWVARRRISR